MENYNSNETNTSKTSKESRDGSAKPAAAAARPIAEILMHGNQHEMIWQRQEEAKEKKTKEDKDTKKTDAPKRTLPPAELKPDTPFPAAKPERTPEPNTPEAEDQKLEQLTPAEAQAIAQQYAANRRAELRDEEVLVQPDSPEEAATVKNIELLERFTQKVQAEVEPEQAIAEAASELIAESDLGNAAYEPEHAAPAASNEAEPNDDEEDTATTPAHAAGGGTTPPSPPPPPGSSTANSSGSQPPQPPQQPPQPPNAAGSPFNPGYPGNLGYSGFNPNVANFSVAPNVAPTTNTVTTAEAAYYARQAENRGLLVGGIVGYLIGRRRGRIKTEKRLKPIQRSLERQVTKLQDTIANREQQVRTLAAEKARSNNEKVAEQAALIASIRPKPEAQPVKPAFFERPHVPQPPQAPERLLAVPVPGERSTRLEAVPALVPIAGNEKQPRPQSPEKHVERLTQVELLKAAETVIVEGASLREAYDAHHITERGLRRVMTEYLLGRNVKEALDRELAIRELTYERDPQMRDRVAADIAAQRMASSQVALDATAQTAAAAAASNDATAKAKAASFAAQSNDPAKQTPNKDNPLQQTLVQTWIAVVVVLVIIVFILLFR